MPSQTIQAFYTHVKNEAAAQNRWCAARPLMRNRVFKCAMAVWPQGDAAADELPIPRAEFIKQAQAYYRQVYGNPILLLILSAILQVVVGIILDWWYHRKDERTTILECAATCHAAGTALDRCLERD